MSFSILVDGGTVELSTDGGRIIFSRTLAATATDLPRLASFAPGRMLREEATLSAGPKTGDAAFLWQDIAADASASAMQRAFESFCDSCDWWKERTEDFSEPQSEIPPLMIRP